MLIKSLSSKKNNFLILFIFIILFIRTISLYISTLELHGDEAQYWYWSTYFDWGYYSKPPLVAWVINFFTLLFGNSVFIIKLPSLIAHFFTSYILFLFSVLLKRSKEESLWLSITYLLFFAVSLSSNIISTDPFLLLFWSLSLYFFKLSLEYRSIKNIAMTSFFVALGFYSKYAMIYFFICSFFLILFIDNKKIIIENIIIIALLTSLLISPHIYWVYLSDWVTVSHTGDNFNWNSQLFNIEQLFYFSISQFFIATPIVFFLYLKEFINFKKFINSYAFEISYSLPIIILITMQSFISRANANWSSVAFISIAMIASNIMYTKYKKTFYVNISIGFIFLIILSASIINPPNISPLNKLQGMNNASLEIDSLDESLSPDLIIFDDRMNMAKFLYGLPAKKYKMRYLYSGNYPDNHFALTLPVTIEQLKSKKVIIIHKYDHSINQLIDRLITKQLYKMPNRKNNFFISYVE